MGFYRQLQPGQYPPTHVITKPRGIIQFLSVLLIKPTKWKQANIIEADDKEPAYDEGKTMRMWLVDPTIMCRKHLLGEHVELHMLVGVLKRGKSIRGFIEKSLLNPSKIYSRHEELVEEMGIRGYAHNSPLEHIEIPPKYKHAKISLEDSFGELMSRCHNCRARYTQWAAARVMPTPNSRTT